MGKLLDRRRSETDRRIRDLQNALTRANNLCTYKACVFATGSFGRGEANAHSDLDLFIAGSAKMTKLSLARLEQIQVKAALIDATQQLKIPPFSGDGEYLTYYTIDELVKTLGEPEDDVNNTFTARLLLLLESWPLVEESVYRSVIREVINAYWRDYQDHKRDFAPGFLANDILRLWRTFCVNYEARTSTEPEEKKAKRKLKNYKLKHSRLLTCYSALMYLLAVYSKERTVSPSDAIEMTSLTPTARLEWLLGQRSLADAHTKIRKLIQLYEEFLSNTDAKTSVLIERFLNPKTRKRYIGEQHKFGDLIFQIIGRIGRENRFHRLLVV